MSGALASLLLSGGMLFVDSGSGKVIHESKSGEAIAPASCMKVVTTGAALGILGREYRFETKLMHDGEIKGGVLHGNLYIVGGGDPTLGKEAFSAWTKALQSFGIEKVEGNIFGDATAWDENLLEPSWLREDVGNYYGAGACALNFNRNSYTLTFRPGKNVGDPTEIVEIDPANLDFSLQNFVKTGAKGSGDQAWIYRDELAVRGTIPAGVETFSIRGALLNPPKTCATLFSREITASEKPFPKSAQKLIHTHHSPPLHEIAKVTNQKSDNVYAEALFKACGRDTGIKNYWKSKGIDLANFVMADGSGLSLKNRCTPRTLVAMLQFLQNDEDFVASLNVRKEGIRAKSGSSSTQTSLVGYYQGKTFAIFTENSGFRLSDLDALVSSCTLD